MDFISHFKKLSILFLVCLFFVSFSAYLLDQSFTPPQGLEGRYYKNSNWEGKPEFSVSDPEISRKVLNSRLKGFSENRFSVVWNGFIVIEKSDNYTFTTSSDDGSRLYINGQLVVDNLGVHGFKEARGKIYLRAGVYPTAIYYFQAGGSYGIELFWSREGQPLASLPPDVLSPPPFNEQNYNIHRILNRFLFFLKFVWIGTLCYFVGTYLFRSTSRPGPFKKSLPRFLKKGFQNSLLLLCTVIVFLSGAEVFFRLAGIARIEPYRDQDWYGQYVRYNTKGFRDYEHPEEKPPGIIRILGIGDSYTFGMRVNFEDIYLTRLERMLNDQYPTRHYEVINMGVPGYNTLSERDLLEKQGLLYQPDLVIIGYVLNDAEHPRVKEPYTRKIKSLIGEESSYSKKLKEISYLYRQLYFLYIWGLLGKSVNQLDFLESLYSEETNPYLSYANQALAEMIQMVKQQNGNVLIALFPVFSLDRNEENRFTKARDLIQGICTQNGAVFTDTYPIFRDILKSGKAKRYWSTPFDAHPGKEAHGIIAEQIFKMIVAERLVAY
jgi:hypothetical protein